MSRVFVISTAVMLAAVTVAVNLLIRGPVPRAVRPGPVLEATPVKTCGPLESLEDLREEIAKAIEQERLLDEIRDGQSRYAVTPGNRAYGLIIRARDCHHAKSGAEVGISEEFWNSVLRFYDGEKP